MLHGNTDSRLYLKKLIKLTGWEKNIQAKFILFHFSITLPKRFAYTRDCWLYNFSPVDSLKINFDCAK